MNDNYVVYKHTNKINGKCYIGISNNYKKRWGSNGIGYYRQSFYRAIKKYGWDNFKHEILFENLTLKEASEKEKELIIKYNSIKYGYNDKEGGFDGISPKATEKAKESNNKKVICLNTNEVFDSIKSAANKYNISSASISRCCRMISNSIKNMNWMYYEDYIKNGIKIKDNKTNINNKNVICFETKEIYNSIKEAGEKTNTSISSIGKCCNYKQKTANGFHWFFVEDYKNGNIEILEKEKTGKKVKVLCLETNKVYDNLKKAQLDTGSNPSSITRCCNQKQKTSNGFHWKYI